MTRSPFFIFLITVPLFFVEAFLEPLFPVTHALIGDWYTVSLNMLHFIFGFIFISLGDVFWRTVRSLRWYTLAMGTIFFVALLWSWQTFDSSALIPLFKVLNMWSWIITVFGFASVYLNKKSNLLKYRNTAVYPFYILHQTITIIIGFFLMNAPMHYGVKIAIMVVGTFAGSWLLYEFIIRRIKWLRPLFGLRLQ